MHIACAQLFIGAVRLVGDVPGDLVAAFPVAVRVGELIINGCIITTQTNRRVADHRPAAAHGLCFSVALKGLGTDVGGVDVLKFGNLALYLCQTRRRKAEIAAVIVGEQAVRLAHVRKEAIRFNTVVIGRV